MEANIVFPRCIDNTTRELRRGLSVMPGNSESSGVDNGLIDRLDTNSDAASNTMHQLLINMMVDIFKFKLINSSMSRIFLH